MRPVWLHALCFFSLPALLCGCKQPLPAVVFQTDFGLKDGAVNAMKGVASGVHADLKLYDLTHEIPAYDVWEAAYRLHQTAAYWPAGTVFVSVVDPGVGTERRSLVVRSKSGHFFVTPDNGTLTLIADALGIEAVRTIDERANRRQGSGDSYTFHGRDVYAYTAARLASGVIGFNEVGPLVNDSIVRLPYSKALLQDGVLSGTIPVLDVQYGNVWTNIPHGLLKKLGIEAGDVLAITIKKGDSTCYTGAAPFANTFGDVPKGKPLVYFNSLMNLSVALNRGSFADTFSIGSGSDWRITLQRMQRR